MKSLLDKEEFSEQDILNIIDSRLEESVNIEFKSAGALTKVPAKKKDISADVSAFANSDGGIIFYGIAEEENCASGVSFIDGVIYSKEWLENVISSSIQQRIKGLVIIPVRFDNDFYKTVYVVKIPKSYNSPHINIDKKFYKRWNFQSVAMEEYEVRDSYFRFIDGNLILEDYSISLDKNSDSESLHFPIIFKVKNDSQVFVENYKVSARISGMDQLQISGQNLNLTELADGATVSTIGNLKIFPDEIIDILKFKISIKTFSSLLNVKNLKIELFIYTAKNTILYDELEIVSEMTRLIQSTNIH
jgi:hypothetical protein